MILAQRRINNLPTFFDHNLVELTSWPHSQGTTILSLKSPSLPTARRSLRGVWTRPSSCGWEMRGNEVGGRGDVGLFEQFKMAGPFFQISN